jgi:hypothetical protein
MIKNVLPFFLNGGVQDVTSGSSDVEWNGSSSFVNISASGARTISFGVADPSGMPVRPGTMVVVMKTDDNANAITVDPSPDMEIAADTFVLDVQNQTCLIMFKAPYGSNTKGEWVMLASDTSSAFDGGTVNSATTFADAVGVTGNLTVTGGIGFFGSTGSPVTAAGTAPTGTAEEKVDSVIALLTSLGLLA